MGIDPSAELARKAAIQEARTKNLETQKRIAEGAPGASPVITKKMTEQDYLRINAKDAQEQSTLIEQLSKKTLRLKKNIEETMAATRVAGGKKTALAALRRELKIVNDELGAAEGRLKTLTTMPEIAGYPKKKGRGGQPTLGKSHKMRLGSAPDISSEMKPKSLSAAAASGATILGEINAQVGASLQLPTNVLDQFLQTLKIQGKGLAEVATRSGFQAADEMALLKDALSKIGMTVEQSLAKPTESLKAMQAVKFGETGEIQALFQRLVMFARDVANTSVEEAFELTKQRIEAARARGAASAKATVISPVAKKTSGVAASKEDQNALVDGVIKSINETKTVTDQFLRFTDRPLRKLAEHLNKMVTDPAFKIDTKAKMAERSQQIIKALDHLNITVEKAIVTDAVKPIVKAAKVVTEASTAIAPSTVDEVAQVVQAEKALVEAVQVSIRKAAKVVTEAAVATTNPRLLAIASGVNLSPLAPSASTVAGPKVTGATPAVSVRNPYSKPYSDQVGDMNLNTRRMAQNIAENMKIAAFGTAKQVQKLLAGVEAVVKSVHGAGVSSEFAFRTRGSIAEALVYLDSLIQTKLIEEAEKVKAVTAKVTAVPVTPPVSALPAQFMSPLGVINAMKPIAPSIPEASTKGKLREILAIRIAEKAAMEERIRNNVRISQSIRAVREAARAANIESVRLPMPIVRAKASGVTLSEQTRERLRIARGATDESSISSVPIPSRPSRRADRASLTRDQFVGQTMLGGIKAVASPLATVKAIGSTIRLAASTAEKIATRLNPAKFAKMDVYKPTDYMGQAREKTFGRISDRNIQQTARQARIAEKDARILAKQGRGLDRPARGVRVLTQSQLPSQFRQTLDPSIQAVKAIANTYGPPLTKALGVAKTRSIQGMKIAGQVAQQIAILPVRVPQIFTTVMDEMHRRVAPLVIKPILKGADALMTGLRAGITKLESMKLRPTSVGTYVLQVAKVLETSLVQVGNISVKAASLLPVVGKALVSASDIATNAIITAFTNPRQALLMVSSSITSGSAIASSFIRKSAVTLRTAFLSIPSLTSSALTLAGNGLMIGAKKVATGAKSLAAATGQIAMAPVKAPLRGMFGIGATPTTDASGNTVKSGGFFRRSTITAPGGGVTRGAGMLGKMGGALGGGIRGLGGIASSLGGTAMMAQLGPAGMALQGPLTKVISLLTKTKGAFFGVTAPIMLVVGAIFILKKTFKAWESSSMGVVDNFKLAWKSISNIIGTLKAVFFDFFASLFGNSKKTDGATKSIGSAMTKVAKTVREVAQAIEKFFNGVVKSALYSFAAGLSLIIRGVVEFVMNVFKFVKALVGFFRGGGQASKDAMNNAWHGMLEGFRKAIKGIAKALHPFLSLLILAVQKVVALIVQIFEFMVIGVVNLIRLMVKGIINLTFTIVKAYVFVIDKIIDVFVFLEKKAIDIVAFLVKGVIKVFFGIIDGVLFVVQKIIEVFGLIPSGIGIIMEKAVGIMAKALGGISWLARKVGLDSLADGIDKFAQSAKDFTSDVVTFGRDTALSIVKSVRSGIGAAEDAATGLVDNVAEKMKKLVSGIGSAGDVIGRVLQGVQNKLLDGVDGAADAVNSFIGGFSDAINSAGDDVRDWLRGLVDGDEITEGIGRQIQDAAGEGVRDPSAAEAAGKTIADAIGKGLSDLKANFYDKVISNLSDSLGKLKDQITKALEKQKDQSLKFFDDQIAAIDALAAADAELTAEKQKQEDERLRIAERALQRDSYIKNRALAIYEGRIEDARTMGLEEAKNQQDFNKETEKNAKEAQLAAKAKNIDTAKKVIENQKQTASVQFDKDLEDFQLFIENIGKYGTLTKDELTSQFNELRAKADQTSGGMQAAFQGYYNALPGLIEKNTDPTVGFFTSSMDALIAGASLKYGLDTGAKDPSTMLGLTNAMMGNLGTVYTNGFTDTVVPAYSEGQNLIKGIADEFADPSTANPKSAAGIYATAIANATIAVKAEFMKMKTEAGSAFAQVVIAINDELKNLAVSKAISDAKEELKNVTKTPTPTVTVPAPVAATPSPTPAPEAPSSEPSTGTESPASAPSPSPVSLRSGAKGIVKEAFEKALGSDKLFKSGDSHEYIKKAKEALSFYGYSGFSSGSGEYGVSTTAAMKAFQKTYKADNVTGNLGVESANMLGLFSNDGVQKKYNGGMIKRMIGGIVPGFSNQGVPALLHGGEYVINAKAVQNIGLSVLGQLNGMKNGIPSINVPKPQMPNSSGMNVNVTSHSQSETIHNYNFTVDNFIGEDRWFESMMKEYNVKVVPNNQKAAGLESRVVRTYNGINKGM